MMRVYFDRELDTVATFWRVHRRDGTTLGFTSHDRALRFGGVTHRAAPGMLPAAIRRTSDLSIDSAEVEGALSHGSIRAQDLAAGLFDDAGIEIGAVDWETLEHHALYSGQLGRIEDDKRGFVAELRSAKSVLEDDIVPRTSPTCRAVFCGPGCSLSAAAHTNVRELSTIDLDANSLGFPAINPEDYLDGRVRFLSGPQTGISFGVVGTVGNNLILDRPLVDGTEIGTRAELLQGCDHTLNTCHERFNNSVNFRGEPFLPGNDLLTRYGRSG